MSFTLLDVINQSVHLLGSVPRMVSADARFLVVQQPTTTPEPATAIEAYVSSSFIVRLYFVASILLFMLFLVRKESGHLVERTYIFESCIGSAWPTTAAPQESWGSLRILCALSLAGSW